MAKAKKTKSKAEAKRRVYVSILLDESSSMSHLTRTVIEQCNIQLRGLRAEAQRTGIETLVTVARFDYPKNTYSAGDHCARVIIPPTNVLGVREITPGDYSPRGNTALMDAVSELIDFQSQQPYAKELDTSFLFFVMTDGQENGSRFMTPAAFAAKIKLNQGTDRWTFAFQVPPGDKHYVTRLGVHEGNVTEWEGTVAGLRGATIQTMSGTQTYFNSAAAAPIGKAVSSSAFYVNTDLSGVSAKQVAKKLDDVSDRLKDYVVAKEATVKEFVEAKTKKPYVIGAAYYQLMKPEKVQPQKQVLIQEKGKKAVWGGPEARALIGLPANAHAKVTPGNHANYDIFVQSASVNRKLPRGTKVLVDTKMSQGVAPTWDHTAVVPKPY